MYTGEFGGPLKFAKLEDAFQVLNKYLNGHAWTAGNEVTIADYSIASTVASIEVFLLIEKDSKRSSITEHTQ